MTKLGARILLILAMLLAFCVSSTFQGAILAAPIQGQSYYVSTGGNDANPGTLDQPWKTIQKCLDQIQPGYTCEIFGGTYNEALVLKISGTQELRITVKNYDNQIVTVNSGSSKTIVTGGRIDYYTIDGLRLIASFIPANFSDVSIELGKNIPFSTTSKTVGNHGFVFRNCYIEGAIHFYGHYNLMENCELNGKNVYQIALTDNFATSFDNIYRNNVIYDYLRAIYSMTSTDNILVDGNTIHDVLFGIDCDGAAIPVTRCNIINNHIYNIGASQWGAGIFLEDCFNCLVQGNTVHDIQNGPGIFVINYGNGSSTNWHTFNNIEYRNQNTNTRIVGNVIYNYVTDPGIYIKAVNGLVIDHNTIYHTGTRPAVGLGRDYDINGVYYCPRNETITNNILFKNGTVWYCTPTTGNILVNNFTGNPLFVNPPMDLHLNTSSPACTAGINGTYVGAFPCLVIATFTPTNTPSYTPTNTATYTLTPSATPTVTPSRTPTPTPTPTKTPTPTRTPECYTIHFLDETVITICKK